MLPAEAWLRRAIEAYRAPSEQGQRTGRQDRAGGQAKEDPEALNPCWADRFPSGTRSRG